MDSTLPQTSFTQGGIPFTLKDGTTDIIAPEARRTYDHIIHFRIGNFPVQGLTDTQANLILSGSHLSPDELETIWQRTENINAPGLPDGYWSQLEIYIGLHYVQAAEKLSHNQMAIQFTGSIPPELTNEIRRRSSYVKAGLSHRPTNDRSPMPNSPSPALTARLRHSMSNATSLTGITRLRIEEENASLSQPGLEVPDTLDPQSVRQRGYSARIQRDGSQSTNSTLGAQRLASLIQNRCPKIHREPEIGWAQSRPIQSSIIDRHSAQELLIRIRRQDPDFTDPSQTLRNKFKSKQAKQKLADTATWQFEPHELSLALKQVVEGEEEMGNPGVARALIDLGADVNTVKRVHKSKLKGSRIETVPINYAQIAASHNNMDMVCLFATIPVSPANLVGALEQAVEHKILRIVLALLQVGVDWSSRGESILAKAIKSQNPTLVKYLLRSPSITHGNFLTKSLSIAVEQGQIEMITLLVTYGAHTTLEDVSALRRAVQLQWIDCVLAIMNGIESSGKSDIASSVVGDAFSTSSTLAVDEQSLLIDILLCAGAKGDPVARVLLQVVRAHHRSIAKLLIKHGADLRFKNAEALRVAVASKDVDMLSTLLLGKVPKEVASSVVDEIPHVCSDERTYSLLSLLIAKGAKGGPLNRALVQAVQRGCNKTTGLLLDHQADVNINNCQPLRIAVTESNVTLLRLLLAKGRPHPEAIQSLLQLIPQSPLSIKLAMVESIINASGQHKIDVAILDDLLLDALRRPSQDEIENSLIPLVDLLTTTGASVDIQRGKCFQLAAETGSLRLLELLISSMSKPASLSPAVKVCREMGDKDRRRDFLCTLSKHGAKGPQIDQALVDLIEEDSPDEALLPFLLGQADLEYLGGQALIAAMRLPSAKIVASIIDTGRASHKIRLNAWQTLYEPKIKQRHIKAAILLRAGIEQKDLDKALIKELGGERDSHIIKLLLDNKASCDYDGGKALELAIRSHDGDILEQLVARCPKHRTIQAMVHKASSIAQTQARLRCLRALIRGGATGEPVSEALFQEVERPGHRDPHIIRFLVEHGAKVDYLDGKALKFVASAPLGVDILGMLLCATAAPAVIAALVPITLSHPQHIRIPLLQMLLDHGAHKTSLDEALVSMVFQGATAQPTIDLLLEHGASANHDRAQAVKVAARAKSYSILDSLLKQNPNNEFLEEAIPLAMQLPSPASASTFPNRLVTVRLLIRTLTNPIIANTALIQAVQEEDNELVECLIKSGASPNSEGGRSVVIATEKLNIRSLQHLFRSKTKPTPDVCSRAFAAMPTGESRWCTQDHLVRGIDRILILGGATGAAVDQTFLSAVESAQELAKGFVRLVLDNQTPLDVNLEGGKCLCIATRKARIDIVIYLLQQTANQSTLRAAFMSIFESQAEEQVLIEMVREFFTCPSAGTKTYFQHHEAPNDALYQVLHRHDDKPSLLEELLANGCDSGSQFPWKFSDSYGDEDTSALLWLLCQGNEGLDTHLVNVLLKHGADPNFRTSQSRISPLTIAASSGRANIVAKLLQAGADPNAHDATDRSPLEYATMAGDLKSMEYIIQRKTNGHIVLSEELLDESLHVAARNLDFAASKLLLEHGFRADLPGPVHAGGRTALAEACCMGDANIDLAQLKRVLALLCKATPDLKIRICGKSMILLALDNASPIKMATALLASHRAIQEGLNEDFNIFTEGSYRYSLTAFVRHFRCTEIWDRRSLDFTKRCCNCDNCDAPELERLLHAYGCQDRFWDAKAGAKQPKAYCNPPLAIITAIQEAEAERHEQARKDQAQRELDAAAEAERRKENERFRRRQEEIAAELRAVEEHAAAEAKAIEQRARAESRAQIRLAEAEASRAEAERQREEKEYNTRRSREREVQDEKERRERDRNRRAEATLRERKNIQIDQKKKELNVRKELQREERKTIEDRKNLADSMAGMFREAQYAGVSRSGVGRILGEAEDAND
ncbi:MAG: hypothetical protein Q9213_007686 [Squamulea squamosa]